MPRKTTLLDAYRFFMPLIFMAEMMMLSHSIIHAALARMPDPKVTLAAFSIAFAFNNLLGSPIWAMQFTALSFMRDKASVGRVLAFAGRIWLVLLAVDAVVVFTPVGDVLYGTVMGASPEVVAQARWATAVLLFIMPAITFRSAAIALIMLNQNTILITAGTLARIVSLVFFLAVLPYWTGGALVGAFGHLLCVHFESGMMVAVAWRYYRRLPAESEHTPRHRDLWRFAWPLFVNNFAESGVIFSINFFLGRLAQADLALAAYGVLHGLVRLLLSPVRNLNHTAQTLVRSREERRMMLGFAGQVVLIFSALLFVLFYTPLSGWVLNTVMGLSAELSGYISPALVFSLLTGAAWGYAALFRGLLTAARNTRPIATSAGIRLAVVVLFGTSTLYLPWNNGAVFGILAFTSAYVCEALVLGWHLFLKPAPPRPSAPGGAETETD